MQRKANTVITKSFYFRETAETYRNVLIHMASTFVTVYFLQIAFGKNKTLEKCTIMTDSFERKQRYDNAETYRDFRLFCDNKHSQTILCLV